MRNDGDVGELLILYVEKVDPGEFVGASRRSAKCRDGTYGLSEPHRRKCPHHD
jgi:hypothetical protein